jgi:hypothetical protein
MVGRFAWIVLSLGLDSTTAFSASILHHHRSKATTQRSTILATTTTVAINDSLDNKKNDQTEVGQTLSSSPSNNNDAGPYRKFAEYAWQRLTALDYLQDAKVDPQLQSNQSAVHPKDGSSVHMTVRALTGAPATTSPIRYARYALLETQLPISTATTAASTTVNAAGSTTIQVLNLVVFPNSDLPVWGADFVSLPGNKHLLLLDAQPMPKMVGGGVVGDGGGCDYSQHWEEWYESHDIAATFPWGGDLPEKVQPFVSKFALWSRLGGGGAAPGTANTPDAVQAMMEGPLYEAYCDHLDRYLHLVASSSSSGNDDQSSSSTTSTTRIGDYHGQRDYIAYRLANDPARPMLKRLFGEEWTEQVLENVLFPPFVIS